MAVLKRVLIILNLDCTCEKLTNLHFPNHTSEKDKNVAVFKLTAKYILNYIHCLGLCNIHMRLL